MVVLGGWRLCVGGSVVVDENDRKSSVDRSVGFQQEFFFRLDPWTGLVCHDEFSPMR